MEIREWQREMLFQKAIREAEEVYQEYLACQQALPPEERVSPAGLDRARMKIFEAKVDALGKWFRSRRQGVGLQP